MNETSDFDFTGDDRIGLSTEVLPDDELLVAYLDGELDPTQRADCERRLLEEKDLRRRLRDLQSGWEMLDELPKATVSDRFTQSTLELVAADLEPPAEAQPRWRRWLRPFGILLAVVCAAVVGVGLVRLTRRVQLQRDIADLPLAAHLDAYLIPVDLDWLAEVHANDQWRETIEAAEDAGAFGPSGLPPSELPIEMANVGDRAAQLNQLPAAERSRLDTAWHRFESLPPEKRRQVRQRANAIQRSEDPDGLLRTLNAYTRFRSNWSAETRQAIDTGDRAAREEAFQQALDQSRSLWLKQLTDEDAEAIYGVLRLVATEWFERLERWAQSEQRSTPWIREQKKSFDEYARRAGFNDREAALLYLSLARRRGQSMFRLNEDDLYAIKSVVSDPMREALDRIMPTPTMQEEVLLGWAIEAVERQTKTLRIDSLQALDPADRLDVELSAPDEMFLQLQQKRRTGLGSGRDSARGRRIGGPRSEPRENSD